MFNFEKQPDAGLSPESRASEEQHKNLLDEGLKMFEKKCPELARVLESLGVGVAEMATVAGAAYLSYGLRGSTTDTLIVAAVGGAIAGWVTHIPLDMVDKRIDVARSEAFKEKNEERDAISILKAKREALEKENEKDKNI